MTYHVKGGVTWNIASAKQYTLVLLQLNGNKKQQKNGNGPIWLKIEHATFGYWFIFYIGYLAMCYTGYSFVAYKGHLFVIWDTYLFVIYKDG